ncbi:MAG: aspartate kinase [Rubricoccaceae bacterium]
MTHDGFSPSPAPTLAVYLAGVGDVGSALLDQLAAVGDPRLRLVGACTTRGHAWEPRGLEPAAARTAVQAGGEPDWPRTTAALAALGPPVVFVDATGSPAVADLYGRLLAAGVHVATPSKLANTRRQADFEALLAAAATGGAHYRYEATVGAGLPVIRVVQDLVATGDRLRAAEGVLSGTMTYLFSRVEAGVPFSEAVCEAVAAGYAEPDPRDDLSGEDVVRKGLILARTAGLVLEREDVAAENLVPEALRGVGREAFLAALPALDAAWAARAVAARREGRVLRYVVRLEQSRLRVGTEAVPAGSALGQLGGTDNLLRLTTDRYARSPLTVQGPGAGPAVTAAGVFADVLDIATRVVAPASARLAA